MKKTVVFIHIPKTAGESLKQSIHHNYKKIHYHYYPYPFPLYHPEEIEFLAGHFAFGWEKFLFLDKETFTFTFVRNPLKRLLSQLNYDFRYFIEMSETDISLQMMQLLNSQSKDSFKNFVELNLYYYYDNCLVRYLSGRWNNVPIGKLTTNDLNLAKKNVHLIDFIGDTDNYESDVLKLENLLGIKIYKNILDNVRDYSYMTNFDVNIIPDQYIDLDIELYQYYLKSRENL